MQLLPYRPGIPHQNYSFRNKFFKFCNNNNNFCNFTRYPGTKVVVYTGDLEASPDEITNRVRQRLNIELPERVEFVYLHQRGWVEAAKYPTFTLLGQSLGSLILGMEALNAFLPGNLSFFYGMFHGNCFKSKI